MAALKTARLLLRQWRPEDREPFALLTSDPEVMRHFPSLLTREESDEVADWFEATIARLGWGMWAVEERASETFIGFTGVVPPRFAAPFMQVPEIGWRLVREAWGRGFATEAASVSAAYAFDQLGVEEVLAIAVLGNVRSYAVMERIGMRRDCSHDHEPPLAATDSTLQDVLYRLRPEQLIRWTSYSVIETSE